jgi:hypothetical protein
MYLIRIPLLLGAFAASLLFSACGTTGEVKATGKTPVAGIDVKVNWGDGQVKIESPKTMCIKVCFADVEGTLLGCTTVETPGMAPVPAGATHWSGVVVSCSDDGDDGMFDLGHGGGHDHASGLQDPPPATPHPSMIHELFGGPLAPIADGSTNVSYSFRIIARTLEEAMTRRDAVLAGGIGTAVGSGFEVIYYNESEAEFDAVGLPIGVRMRQAEVADTIDTYTLTVNDTVVADLLAGLNVTSTTAENDWTVVECFVPTSKFEAGGPTYDNEARANWTTLQTSKDWTASQRVFDDTP